MRDSVMWLLVCTVLISSMFVVMVRHQHRIAYTVYQAEESRRDALNDEWGQLLIEENLWAFPHRIEKDAIELLSMRAPVAEETQYIGLPMSFSSSSGVAGSEND